MGAASMQAPEIAYLGLAPLILLVASALAVLLVDAFWPGSRRLTGGFAIVVLVAAVAMTLRFMAGDVSAPMPGQYAADDYAHIFDLIFYTAAIAAAALSLGWLDEVNRGEYYALLLLATAGMVSLAHAASLVTLFIALELMSVVLYALTGFLHERERAAEAALKYFFLGAFASGFLLFGSALLYGVTGSLELGEIGSRILGLAVADSALGVQSDSGLLLGIGAAMLLVGFGFKISAVPFHMWTPDVYEGAPTPIAAFMSVGTKAAAFAALMRVFTVALGPLSDHWRPIVAAIAVATMLVGNLVALQQLKLKRLLAFSSVAHAGYALVGLVAWEAGGRGAVVFYLLAYAAMNLGAFGVVAALERRGEGLTVHDLAGLSERRPLAAAALALFLLSLAGVPPTAGFFGKFNLLLSAIEAGWIKLAVVAVLYSAIAAYYYIYPIVVMYMHPVPREAGELESLSPGAVIVLAVSAAGVLLLGILPGGVLTLIEAAVRLP